MEYKEIWKSIPASTCTGSWWKIADYYEASSLGRIRNKKTGRILTPTMCGQFACNGEQPHMALNIDCPRWKGQRIHVRVSHLVWAAFTGESVDNVRIYHLDGNFCNNAFYNLATHSTLKKLGLK